MQNVGTLAPAQESGGSAMPRQQISAKANGIRPSPVVTAPSPALADKKTQDVRSLGTAD